MMEGLSSVISIVKETARELDHRLFAHHAFTYHVGRRFTASDQNTFGLNPIHMEDLPKRIGASKFRNTPHVE